jgi:hypothetical protein
MDPKKYPGYVPTVGRILSPLPPEAVDKFRLKKPVDPEPTRGVNEGKPLSQEGLDAIRQKMGYPRIERP